MLSLLEQELERRAEVVRPNRTVEEIAWLLNEWGWLNRKGGVPYQPNPGGQQAFHESEARFRALVGSRGSGKTVAGVQEALRMIRERPGQPGAMLCPNVPHWNHSTWPEVEKWIPWDHVVQHHKTEKWLLFDNGSQVWYGGIASSGASEEAETWRGPNLNWLWYDEARGNRSIRPFLILLASVRVGPDPKVWVTTTPRGKRHWLYEFFVEKRWPQEFLDLIKEIGYEGPLVEWFHATVEENKAHVDPLFYATLVMSYTGAFKRQEVGGEFVEEGGTLAQRAWFEIVDAAPADAQRARGWDLAATEKKLTKEEPDYVAGAKVAMKDGIYFIEHIVRGQYGPNEVEQLLVQTARADGPLSIGVEEEPGASGKLYSAHLVKLLTGFYVQPISPTGDKVSRAMPWLGQAQAGNVKLVKGPWNEAFLDEVEEFPVGNHDDQVDAVSVAIQMLGGPPAASATQDVPLDVYQAQPERSQWI